MKITILNGNPDNQKFDDYLDNLVKMLELSDNRVVHFAIDFRTSSRFVMQTDIPVQEVSDEINRI